MVLLDAVDAVGVMLVDVVVVVVELVGCSLAVFGPAGSHRCGRLAVGRAVQRSIQ